MLTDFDPDGQNIAESFARSMRDDFKVERLTAVQVALTHKQVTQFKLPPQMKAKAGSSTRARFVERYGDDVFELEALPPERLERLLRNAIGGVLDHDAFEHEQQQEREDATHLHGVRRGVQRIMFESFGIDADDSGGRG